MGFDSFIGNPRAVRTAREMLSRDHLPGALLFTGPEGVGKKTLALMLARAAVCEKGGSDFCGECVRCRRADEMFAAAQEDLVRRRGMKEAARRVEGLVYFDLQLIAPLTRFILTEQIRQLRTVAYTRPFELPRRIFIIDEAQAIHWQAVDVLLKVLEEPPATTILILVCSNAYELRTTIRSRCQRIPFQPVEEPSIRELLAKDQRLPKSQQDLAARVVAGSVARALTFAPDDYRHRRQPWLDFLAAVVHESPHKAAAPDLQLLFDSSRALAENREDFEDTLRIGYVLLRDLLQILEGGADKEVVNVDLLADLRGWASGLGLAGIEKLKTGLDQAYRLQVRNVNQQLGFETLGLELLSSSRPGPA